MLYPMPQQAPWLCDADTGRLLIEAAQRRSCAKFVRLGESRKILLVGPERRDEFAHALELMSRGHDVTAINPRESSAARAFHRTGGKFVRARIERLPGPSRFDLIFENYPYPSGKNYEPANPFAVARLARLAPGGCWIVYTEALRFASLLKSVIDYDPRLVGRFTASLRRISFDAAPPSHYPANDLRYRLICRRLF
jgi:hypothetical protein